MTAKPSEATGQDSQAILSACDPLLPFENHLKGDRKRPYVTQAASQAEAFYAEVAGSESLWTIRDDAGFLAPLTAEGYRSQPSWSLRRRVEKIIKTVPAYTGFTPHEISWLDFHERWVPGLSKDGIKVGVNWSGPHATGYDVDSEVVQRAVENRKKSSPA